MPEEVFETPQPTQPLEPKITNWPKIVLAAVLGLGLLFGATYAGYWYGTESSKLPSATQTQETPTPKPTTSPTPIPTLEPTPTPSPTPPTPTEEKTECVREGDKIGIPEALAGVGCCIGLVEIHCLEPYADGRCPIGGGDCSVCANCGDKKCGLGENKCNCPQDCE